MYNNKLKAVTFSYDDGTTQDIRLVELMHKYGLKGTFNLNSERLGENSIMVRDDLNGLRIARYRVHPNDVKYVYEGHEVAAHTLTHPNLGNLEKPEIIRQVEQDRLNLSELVGYDVVGMAYPYGAMDDNIAGIIRENTGIKYSRTVNYTDSFDPQEDLLLLKANAFHLHFDKLMAMGQQFIELEAKTPQIFYIWGHSYELDFRPDYWNRLEEFFKLISNKDDIFYGTNKDVLL